MASDLNGHTFDSSKACVDENLRKHEFEEQNSVPESLDALTAPPWAIPGSDSQPVSSEESYKHMVRAIAVCQDLLFRNETTIAELQAEAGEKAQKLRLWQRRAEQSEAEKDEVLRQQRETEESLSRLRARMAPLAEKYMEAEVLKSQFNVASEENARLRDENVSNQQELTTLRPRCNVALEAASRTAAKIADIEAEHTAEMAKLRSDYLEEVAALRARQTQRMSELEAGRSQEVSGLKAEYAGEVAKLRGNIQEVVWQGDGYLREQQDYVRDLCLRQNENSRLFKQHCEARREAMSYAVQIEAYRAAGGSRDTMKLRQAEFQATKRRCELLERTASEWRLALEQKQNESEEWRRRCVNRGGSAIEDEADADTSLQPRRIVEEIAWEPGGEPAPLNKTIHAESSIRAEVGVTSPSTNTARSSSARAASTSPYADVHRQSQSARHSPATPARRRMSPSRYPSPPSQTVIELLSAMFEEAHLKAESARFTNKQPPGEEGEADASVSLGWALEEAEHEVDIQTFLLDESDFNVLEHLVQRESRRQPPTVMQHLNERLAQIMARG